MKKNLIKRKTAGRPTRTDKDNKTAASAEKGTIPGDKRKTYIVQGELADKIEAIAHWDRVSIKQVVQEAFTDKVNSYEKQNGPIKSIKK